MFVMMDGKAKEGFCRGRKAGQRPVLIATSVEGRRLRHSLCRGPQVPNPVGSSMPCPDTDFLVFG
jgi:hypothetical protein